ncbi:uncharacterized protein CXQ87_002726 [Candidozyma duobushaemuli]|uniref:Uncharacterized protein n=2 Tax=Candidozyma TaxID=3303203 RepID=A0ABX8I1Z8_9ASCO|nr:uncharacterized protein CXQ87_002726 [[Candida] duobushaemulonis]PVH14582.1 hypothetical protein CXQ87_002726 [[Candida] duobushaemulonis]QWU87261.1 hypothetical protein CA3LBN_001526 [[Candida] haemuloni]
MAVVLEDYFSVQVFFIVLRETIESAIIISVLLAFVNKSLSQDSKESQDNHTEEESENCSSSNERLALNEKLVRSLRWQIWVGGLCGFLGCLVVGAVILVAFYTIGADLWSGTEHYWEATFSVVASVIISAMGVQILRVNRMQQKWHHKLGSIINGNSQLMDAVKNTASWSERNAMFILPFVTTLREGLEAIVFVGGIGINENTTVASIVNSAILAMIIGTIVGFVLYRSGNTLSLQWFLIVSTCFLYLVAAGLFSKGIWQFELQSFIDKCGGMDVSETGHGPGSYDIENSVWHVNCCNGEMPEDGVQWMLFTAIFGWTNSATYGSVIGYNVYWIAVISMFWSLFYEDKHGKLPLIPVKWQQKRIRKRLYFTVPQQQQGRQSGESINSQTPLQTA